MGEVVVAQTNGESRRMPITGGDGGTTAVTDNQTELTALAYVGPALMFVTSSSRVSGLLRKVSVCISKTSVLSFGSGLRPRAFQSVVIRR
ncbi:MAG: hypothetical protein KF782_17725 [Labilithrix sp.]|nr:hypothetical protein [Labilithrix sp.]